MLTQEERDKEIVVKSEHFPRAILERKYLFPNGKRLSKCCEECTNAIRDPMQGIFLKDERIGEKIQSNYVCVFLGESGMIIAVPCHINEHITPLTIKDVQKDFKNPNWFINGYNEIALKREMETLPRVIKTW